MAKENHIPLTEDTLRTHCGATLLKPDSVALGIEAFLIDYISQQMQAKASAELAGVMLIENMSKQQVGQIYPSIEEGYFKACCDILADSPSIAMIFVGNDQQTDLWATLKQIRGKVNKGSGFRDSVRAALPIPGDYARYNRVALALHRGSFTHSDYIDASANLMHVPEDIHEFAGLMEVINDPDLFEEIFKGFGNIHSDLINQYIRNRE